MSSAERWALLHLIGRDSKDSRPLTAQSSDSRPCHQTGCKRQNHSSIPVETPDRMIDSAARDWSCCAALGTVMNLSREHAGTSRVEMGGM